MTLLGRRVGTACYHSTLFGRYMKAQLRLAGDRRKLGRNGLSSDIPRECVDPPENLRNLRNLATCDCVRNLRDFA